MKSFQQLLHLPHLPHINPISRDIMLIAGVGLLIAMAVTTLVVMIVSQI